MDDEPQDPDFYNKGGYPDMAAALATFRRSRERRSGSLARLGIRQAQDPIAPDAPDAEPLRRAIGQASGNPFERKDR